MRYLLSTLVILLTVITLSSPALAGPGSLDGLGWGGLKSLDDICGEEIEDPDKEELRVFSVVVGCFENVVFGLAETNIVLLSGFLQNAVSAAITLFIILFGMKVATGMTGGERLKGEFFITLLKAAFVGWLVLNAGLLEMWSITVGVYNGIIEIVLSPASMGECQMTSSSTDAVWETMDCLFTAIMGYSKENGFGTSWTGVALLSLIMGAKLFENVGGTLIFGILASAIYAIIMAFIRLAFIYMLSIMGLILLYTIAPLFIPMMMFQRTKMMFERWYQTVISFIMQVCIMFAFFSFIAPIIYDIALGPNGLVAMYKELKAQNQIASMKTSGVEDTFDQVIGIFSKGDDKTKELIYNFISLLMMSYLVLSFIKFIDQLAHELAGSISARNLSTYAPQAMGSGFQLFGGK